MISSTTKEFWNLFEALPKNIQNQAVKAYELWNKDPHHPGLHFKTIHSTEPLYSVRISRGYRALGLKQGTLLPGSGLAHIRNMINSPQNNSC